MTILLMSGKKVLAIVFMAVLASSVLATAISVFSRINTTNGNNNQKEITIGQLNTQINNVVNFCLGSLPNGKAECDSQFKIIDQVCNRNIPQLDVCHNGKIAQYYKIRDNSRAEKGLNSTK
jgi:hypothetical protein